MNPSVITQINSQNRNRRRYSVFVDDEYAFSVHEGALAKLGLRVGQTVDSAAMQEAVSADDEARAMDSALRYLAVRNRSAGEIRRKLGEKGYEEQTTEKVIHRLQELELVNDSQFATTWISHSLSRRPVGRRRLTSELLQKGVDRTVVAEALPPFLEGASEVRLAVTLIRSKVKSREVLSDLKERRKVAALLQRRGFDYGTIEEAFREVEDSES